MDLRWKMGAGARLDKRSASVLNSNFVRSPSRHSCSGTDVAAANAVAAVTTRPYDPAPKQLLHHFEVDSAVIYPWMPAGCLNRGIASVAAAFPNYQAACLHSPVVDS